MASAHDRRLKSMRDQLNRICDRAATNGQDAYALIAEKMNQNVPAGETSVEWPSKFSQFVGAEMIARNYGFDRETLDRFALESHHRAALATRAGAFKTEIVPVPVETSDGIRPHVQDFA